MVQKSLDQALYLYCIGPRENLRRLMQGQVPPGVEPESPLSLFGSETLAAVGSRVSAGHYAQEEPTLDPAWMAPRILRHQEVVEFFARRAPVIPLRFGAIYRSADRVRSLLRRRRQELSSLLEKLTGREEWGINVYSHPQVLVQALMDREASAASGSTSASRGRAYLLGKALERKSQSEAGSVLSQVVSTIETELGASSDEFRRLPVQAQTDTDLGRLAARLVFLVPRAGLLRFRQTAESLADEQIGLGIQLELSGPWPVYNFVGSLSDV